MAQITELKGKQRFVFTDKSGFLWNLEMVPSGGFLLRKTVPENVKEEFSDQIVIFPMIGNKIKVK